MEGDKRKNNQNDNYRILGNLTRQKLGYPGVKADIYKWEFNSKGMLNLMRSGEYRRAENSKSFGNWEQKLRFGDLQTTGWKGREK